ncbi:HlyD family efflux transporter periplasmic adaptor subunit [Paracrocinitomix mangrovi]|uniref:efflux RND transporter periplasmic adaptor subunit n=1 Tax=Paracrocinitomix mangrovi TaxID=2862509 RepID=UPI001C8E2A95|nr:HlyD family efflux transporter periplasmic adaptor subunit [Paracrocinitomix mangrovi]UKN03093.1 HlyD family efflux transporter periplasmic adaptor subunit [Paracrocinitomix mangrovi]
MKVRHVVIIAIFVGINILIFSSLDFSKDEVEEVEIETVVPILKASEVKITEEQFNVEGYGTISAFNSVDISSEVQGKLSKGRKELKEGVKFKKGELIFSINDTEAQYNLRARKSGFINIIAQLLPDIKIDFPSEFDKWNDYIGDIKLNERLPTLPAWKTKKEKIFLSTRNVLTEYFAIKALEEQLAKFHVYAPFSGVVTAVFVSDYTVINPGTKVLTLAQTENFEIAVSIPASSVDNIEIGTECDIFTTSGELKGKGKVSRISEVINKSTQSVEAYIKPKPLDGYKFIEGEYLKVAINETGVFKGFRVPLSAVKENEVMIYNKSDSTLSTRTVSVLNENNKGLFINGVDNNEIVITQEVRNYNSTTKYGVLIK